MTISATFKADLSSTPIPLRHPWRWCVGSGHATLALRADWQKQLSQARKDLGFEHVRFHGILDDDMGTLVCEDDEPLYSFFNTDRIFDFLLSIGMKPVVELSFMPRMLSSGSDIVFHYQGNITAPKDYAQWAELIRRLASHWVERYGIEEVSQWPFECWNEPNLNAFWLEGQDAYFKLFKTTARALQSVDSRLKLGGPVTADNAWLADFDASCTKSGVDAAFISTHFYPTDPFGKSDTDTISQLRDAPRGVMRDRALDARKVAGKRPLYYTEWSISSNPRDPFHDSSFAAAFATRIVMSVDDVVDGYSYWTFTDIFEENYFPSMPFHGGFGMMNLYGIPKPIYRAFQMVAELGNARVDVAGEHDTVSICAAHAAGTDATTIVLVNLAMPEHPIGSESVRLRLTHRPDVVARAAKLARIDDGHVNPERAWREMGKPEYLNPKQVEVLTEASNPVDEPIAFIADNGLLEIGLVLAPQSVNRLRIEWQVHR